jgi:hypothetical protein
MNPRVIEKSRIQRRSAAGESAAIGVAGEFKVQGSWFTVMMHRAWSWFKFAL